ncbi:MAG: hypothetical protein COW01_03115 [Bdellovibrionales bacterium CG12_big_fil_rev_8_21_14_0_65_38_15]|nr:MAG: hypothetical protein COW79_12355 [Bdellovibrionales bacterium CG22_combo_CG10-13_8_21_14_all_38_13]PIQ56835.1 MAG: hypothetical protein COW01_03115 [Bdellovibrionales bacterium CG12_big_fil_rev_8_21_14_0_65_38_15]PIR29756.1 MAG: hypothetical protein COV38_09005 [Bdellovibrionales bacterium CG11_big_fil_rev_8_21_14_0_20_38_13]
MANRFLFIILLFLSNAFAQTSKVTKYSYTSTSSSPEWKCQCQDRPDGTGISGIISDIGSKSKSYLQIPKNAKSIDRFLYALDMSSMPGFKEHQAKILSNSKFNKMVTATTQDKLRGKSLTYYITNSKVCAKMKEEFVKVSRKQNAAIYKNCVDMFKRMSK